jgi:cell division protein FtsQ
MAAEVELRQPELTVEEDEPRYLRRQKPVEIRKRKLGRKGWQYYARVAGWLFLGALLVAAGTLAVRFALYSPRVQLADLEQIQVRGNQFVPRSVVLEKFAADQGRSVLRIPLEERRAALEQIPWVERATVHRVLPNGVRVEIAERTPVAFLRSGTELALLDGQGVLLERPLEGDFAFPVVTGISELTPLAERRKRMHMFLQFLKGAETARAGGAAHISEVDLSDAADLRAVVAGIPELTTGEGAAQESVLVHFGEGDFLTKYKVFIENLAEWRASVGRVVSVDLRFARQVVVNPETPEVAHRPEPAAPAPGSKRRL